MALISGAILVLILSAVAVGLLWCLCPSRFRRVWMLAAMPLIVPLLVAYCLYFSPVWFGNGSFEYYAWAPLFIIPWFVAGLVSSAAVAVVLYVTVRKHRAE